MRPLTRAAARAAPSARVLKGSPLGSPLVGPWLPQGVPTDVSDTVSRVLADVRDGGEAAALQAAETFDGLPAGVSPVVDLATVDFSSLPAAAVADMEYQHRRITAFARAQLACLQELDVDMGDGIQAGHRVIPVSVAGCYVPGGRFSHVSSAFFSIAVAKAAGVEHVVAASPPARGTTDIHLATLYAMKLAGADAVLAMGGVQAVASMAQGLFSSLPPADVVVGPGNAFVAEAKRQLFGGVGIDVIAGPTEVLIVADDAAADPATLAIDLVSQAEHGPTSPAWLITTDERLAVETMAAVDAACDELCADVRGNPARDAWRDWGEVVVVGSREEAAALCDVYAAEHLQVFAPDAELDWWLGTLRNYGGLFLGGDCCVTFGDKVTGPSHILPTRSAARYSQGCSVSAFVKILTYQRMRGGTADHQELAATAARISRLEGMEGHARSADARLV